MDFPADAPPVRVVPRRGQHDHRLLPPGGVRTGGEYIPQPPVGLGVELVDDDGGKRKPVLGGGIAGIDLHHAAVPAADLTHAVPAPHQGVVLRLAQGGVLHHVLRALVDDVRIGLVGGEDAHLGPGLPVRDQVVEAQTGGEL